VSSPESGAGFFLIGSFLRGAAVTLLPHQIAAAFNTTSSVSSLSGISLRKIVWKNPPAASSWPLFPLAPTQQAFWRSSATLIYVAALPCSGYLSLRQHSRIQGQISLHVVGSSPGRQEEVAHDRFAIVLISKIRPE